MTTTDVEPVMRARAVSKVYGATHALRGVDFAVHPGRVTALLGENGAGKSTLMKILAGIVPPTSGSLELDGEPVAFRSTKEASQHGIAIIHQELSLCPNLSIVDNLFLARELVRGGVSVDQRRQRALAADLLKRLEHPMDPRTPVGQLRLGQQQVVEIARALLQDARVLIMDEPTSALSSSEVEVLFGIIRDLTARGVSIIYISHHLEEALEIADQVVVLRDGELVATADAAEVDIGWVVARLVGRDLDSLFVTSEHTTGEPLLQAAELVVADPTAPGRRLVDEVSLSVRAGEVVAVYGLMGSGRTELLEALAGRIPVASGRVSLGGRTVTEATIRERISGGLALVPEDRQRDGLVPPISVGKNMSLAALSRFLRGGSLIARRRERAAVAGAMTEMTVKASGPDAPVDSLSGGNQQKALIGKALLTEPRVLLLDEPTRGIDVGAKAEIFEIMAAQARAGRGVLFATSEIAEALRIPDRLLVMSKGRILGEFRPGGTNQEQVMRVAQGQLDAGRQVGRTQGSTPAQGTEEGQPEHD